MNATYNIEPTREEGAATASLSQKLNQIRRKKNKRAKKKYKASATTDIRGEEATQKRESSSSNGTSAKRQKRSLPLKGLVLSVSTLKEGNDTPKKSPQPRHIEQDGPNGYNEVCEICKLLGAQVTSQVSKRVRILVCTKSAVEKATQRVRKAFKKKIPIVGIQWLEACQKQEHLVDMDPYLLDLEAKVAILNREKNLSTGDEDTTEVDPSAGWTEGISFGCSCVCHENGAEKECQWCSNGCTT